MPYEKELTQLATAVSDEKITESAAENIRNWLSEDRYAEYVDQIIAHIRGGKWQALDDAFWTIIPFGTGGRRGKMYPIGSNAINDRTIGESAQGLANYVRSQGSGVGGQGGKAQLSCAIGYDTRHRSTHFAKLCAEIMVAAGFKVYFLDGHRSTPELSFTVRAKECDCGIMVTASHNPPSDNAVKVYWSTGGQILPPHDKRIIDCVMNVDAIERTPWDGAVASGAVEFCQDAMDEQFINAVLKQAIPGPRDLKIVYSPLHGVGATAVCPALERDGFNDVEVFALHAKPDGDFPNVPGHVSNPENPAVFDSIIERAKETNADLALATDPDCDRIGCAAPRTMDAGAEWATISGNQIGALLADWILDGWKAAGKLTPEHFIVETLVTTQLIKRIGDSYGVKTVGDLLVGFKWIAGVIDDCGPERFVYGTEESHGYMAGTYVRDKDGAVAAMLLCELAAKLKSQGKTLHEKLDDLFWQHGVHAERTVSVQMPGSEGMADMKALMARLRAEPPSALGGLNVVRSRDYLNGVERTDGGKTEAPLQLFATSPIKQQDGSPITPPRGDLVMLDLAEAGNYAAVRPSGTEPKVKFYLFAYEPPEQLSNLENAKAKLEARLAAMERDLRKCAGA